MVERDAETDVVLDELPSGASTSRLICVTTKTSLSRAFNVSSISVNVKVSMAVSTTLAEICIGLDVDLSPFGM